MFRVETIIQKVFPLLFYLKTQSMEPLNLSPVLDPSLCRIILKLPFMDPAGVLGSTMGTSSAFSGQDARREAERQAAEALGIRV